MDRVYVGCQISKGAFSGERVFEFKQENSVAYIGVSPAHYCYTVSGDPLDVADFSEEAIQGKIAARRLSELGDAVRVALPDGQTAYVPNDLISDRSPESMGVPI